MIVIINGPLGIGKTEVSWSLLWQFDRAVMLDGDYLGAVHPFEIYDEERVDYLYRTLQHVTAFHKQNGYANVVINYVFETPETLADLRARLAQVDDQVYAFRLVCSPEEHARRIRCRAASLNYTPDQLDWELRRGPQLVAIQEAAAQQGDLGTPVDTTRLSAVEAAGAIRQQIHENVILAPYDPAWAGAYAAERQQIQAALGDLALEIHHIGSTAVPGLSAKPVIDLLVAVEKLEDAEACKSPLQALGYAFVDYPENVDRRYFRKGFPRSHHLHIVAKDSPAYADHVDFRDALRADPALREGYARLKAELAERHRHDRGAYTAAKSDYVQNALKAWRSRPSPHP